MCVCMFECVFQKVFSQNNHFLFLKEPLSEQFLKECFLFFCNNLKSHFQYKDFFVFLQDSMDIKG